MTLRPSTNPRHGLVLANPRRRQVVRRCDLWAIFNAVMVGAFWAALALAVVTVLWTRPVAR